jgi:hypothetical protein
MERRCRENRDINPGERSDRQFYVTTNKQVECQINGARAPPGDYADREDAVPISVQLLA